MGCDIHLHIEMKVKGKWLHYGCPSMDRDYRLFAKMANVRNYHGIDPISEARGFPCDGVSEVTAVCYAHDKPDVHDISWLTKTEIEELTGWYESKHTWDVVGHRDWKCWNHHCIKSYLCGNNITSSVEGIEDVRFVFWFDN